MTIAGIATVLLKALVSVCIWLHTNQQAYSLMCIFTVGKPNGCPSLISHLKQHGFFFFLMKHARRSVLRATVYLISSL